MGLALNRSGDTDRPTAAAICREIELDEGEAPEWVQLLPLGPAVMGRDGRSWTMPDPEAVVAASELPLVGDCEHATELKAVFGEPAPAKAWAEELRVFREGNEEGKAPGIWARVAWNQGGAYLVKNLEYRFVSPVFLYEVETNEITRLTSWGLTNRPNLKMTALNREDGRLENEAKETVMNEEQRKALCQKLGLPEDATVEQITARAAEAAEARNAQLQKETVPRAEYDKAVERATNAEQRLAAMVPKADLDAANERATNAEKKLEEQETKALNARAKAVLDKAQEAG
ncbi:MAG: phage protease, partial [Polyangiales bacterium]